MTAEEVGVHSDREGRRRIAKQPRDSVGGEDKATTPHKDAYVEYEQLFDFDNVANYLIPKAPLCGRLITCTTAGVAEQQSFSSADDDKVQLGQRAQPRSRSKAARSASRPRMAQRAPGREARQYKVLSHPMLLEDPSKYQRNTFVFNLCFVFDGKADVKSFEPVVRKCARALRVLEENASFLSSPHSQPRMHGVVEQMYQDLNSYCEAFIDLPDAPHTSYLQQQQEQQHRDERRNQDAKNSPAALRSYNLSFTPVQSADAPGVRAFGHSQREAMLGLSATADGLLQDQLKLPPSLADSRRSSASSAAALGTQESVANESQIGLQSRRPSNGSGRLSGIPGPPHWLRGATTPLTSASRSTAAATLNAQAGPNSVALQRDFSSSSHASHPSVTEKATAGSAALDRATSPPHADYTRPVRSRDPSVQAIVDDLNSSVMSMRRMSGETSDSTHPTVAPVMPLPPPRPLGQRDPPHGLGRTVRDAINLKLFPTYANPPPVRDWDVPVSLLDLGSRRTSDSATWDLTMARVYPWIDGINHVKRISQLADADLELTRQCMEHLLYYGCILMVDVFQFFNVYVLKPAIARMADDPSIQAECGPYVVRPGHVAPPWPTLLNLYTALRPGVVLEQWIEERNVETMGIDARRFVTFGIIKGFLRRVHRYPVLIGGPDLFFDAIAQQEEMVVARDIQRSLSADRVEQTRRRAERHRSGSSFDLRRPSSQRQLSDVDSIRTVRASQRPQLGRRPGSAKSLTPRWTAGGSSTEASRRDLGRPNGKGTSADCTIEGLNVTRSDGSRGPASILLPTFNGVLASPLAPTSSFTLRGAGSGPGFSSIYFADETPTRQRGRRGRESRESEGGQDPSGPGFVAIPPDLPYLLDGTHCEDELCVRFGLSWPQLRRMLIHVGQTVAAYQQYMQANARKDGGGGSDPASRDEETTEMPANGASSGFAGQSAFFGGSAWNMPVPTPPAAAVPPAAAQNLFGSYPQRPPPRADRNASYNSGAGSCRDENGMDLGGSTGEWGASFGPHSWNWSLDGLEIEEGEEELERRADFGGVVILTT